MTDLIEVGTEKIDLVRWNGFSIEAERIAEGIVITDDVEEGMAVDSLSRIKTFQKQTEDARKLHVEPFNILVKRVNNAFKPIAESLERAEAGIKEKIKFYRVQKERVRQEEESRRRVEYEKQLAVERAKAKAGESAKIVAPPPTIMPAATTTHGDVGAATSKKFWNFEVVDMAALAAARPDLVKIEIRRRETLAAIKDGKAIAGLRLFEDMEIAAR
jgi:aspartate carbamoyltransferase catalytic subunit